MKKPDVKKTRIKKTLCEVQNWLMSTNLDEIVLRNSRIRSKFPRQFETSWGQTRSLYFIRERNE